jgi:N-methylhydantoinase A/oxoprolinase/acetone carboxylase beta subunit
VGLRVTAIVRRGGPRCVGSDRYPRSVRALAELLTICACALTIGGFAVRHIMGRLGRKKLQSNREFVKQLEQENRELDEMLDRIKRSDKERGA